MPTAPPAPAAGLLLMLLAVLTSLSAPTVPTLPPTRLDTTCMHHMGRPAQGRQGLIERSCVCW